MEQLCVNVLVGEHFMKTKTSTKTKKEKGPIIIEGSHSTRIEHPDGRVEFTTHWDKLVLDVRQALADYEFSQMKPAIKAKTTRKKKDVK